MLPPPLVPVLAVILGLAVGSFLNVVIYRLPRRLPIAWARSRCPYCHGRVAARDNVPVLSYLLLGGRCRRCRAPIAVRYPVVEGLTAALFAACAARFATLGEILVSALFCALLVALAAIDLEHFLLPDSLTLSGVVAGLGLQRWLPGTTFFEAVLGALVGAGILILVVNFWYWLRGEEGMGLGDVNMLAMVGAFLGWKGVVLTLVLGALGGALVGIALLLLARLGRKSKLPFGLLLALGALVALFWGAPLMDAYLRLL